jgi:hypothetical protein
VVPAQRRMVAQPLGPDRHRDGVDRRHHARRLDWQHLVKPGNAVEIDAISTDAGRTLGYVRVVARRNSVPLDPPITGIATDYQPAPLLRADTTR